MNLNSFVLFVGYLIVGWILIRGALYITKYDLETEGFDFFRVMVLMVIMWPLFLILMIGYWCWVWYHNIKYWVKSL